MDLWSSDSDSFADEPMIPDTVVLPMPMEEWQEIWLGIPGEKSHDGLFQIIKTIRAQEIAIFERKITIGDASKDSDDYISTLIQGNYEGGGQVEQSKEGTDVSRYWDGKVDAYRPFNIALPPLVRRTKPAGASGVCYPLGDVHSTVSGRASTSYFAFGTHVYGWNAGSNTWYSVGAVQLGAGTAEPSGKAMVYKGEGSETLLHIPLGAYGYATLKETTPGTPQLINYPADATHPAALKLAKIDTRLQAISTDGRVFTTNNVSDDWDVVQKIQTELDGTQNPLRFDMAEQPMQLQAFMNKNGDAALFMSTDQAVWALNENDGIWVRTAIEFPPHSDAGLAMAVWRAGEDLWASQGMDFVRMTNAQAIVPDSGLMRDHGIPIQFRGKVVDLQPEMNALYAAVEGNPAVATTQTWLEDGSLSGEDEAYLPGSNSYPSIWAWTGKGWHKVWDDENGEGAPTWMYVPRVADNYRLWWGSTDGYAYNMFLRKNWTNARAGRDFGIDEYAEAGYLLTSEFDMEMEGYDKQGSHGIFNMRYADAQHRIDVSYRTDRKPNFITLGTVNQIGRSILAFDPDGDGFSEGETFNWIQFQLQAARGSLINNTPLLNSFSLAFVKVPRNTEVLQFTIPLPIGQDSNNHDARSIVNRLKQLRVESKFLALKLDDRQYRGKISGLSTQLGSGKDFSGSVTVNFISIKTGLEAPFPLTERG